MMSKVIREAFNMPKFIEHKGAFLSGVDKPSVRIDFT